MMSVSQQVAAATIAWFARPEPTLGLALARITLGLVLTYDGVQMLRSYELWYGRNALRPRRRGPLPAWLDAFTWAEHVGLAPRAVFVTMVLAALAFALGVGTSIAAALLLLTCLAIPPRNLFVVYGGDAFARTTVLLLACSPCAASLSVDRWLLDGSAGLAQQAPLWGGRLIAVEVAILYFYNFFYKWAAPAWRDGSYLVDLVHNRNYACARIPALLHDRRVGRLMTWSALLLELVLGPVLLCPATAGIAVLVAIVFHLAIAWVMDVHLFSYVMIAALLACLPRSLLAVLAATRFEVLATPELTWTEGLALLAVAAYIVIVVGWDPPVANRCSRMLQRVLGPVLDGISWSRSWRLFVDSSASHIEIEITVVTADGERLRWTWDRADRLLPDGSDSRPATPNNRFQRFKFSVVKHAEARELLVARVRAALAESELSLRGLSIDVLYQDVHTLAVLGGINLHTELLGFDYEACVLLLERVRLPLTRRKLLEILLLAGIHAALHDRPRAGLRRALTAVRDGSVNPSNLARLRSWCAQIPEPSERALLLATLDRLHTDAHA